jgi:prepilin-type N-terminal cleavage/methylation domain-containing protein
MRKSRGFTLVETIAAMVIMGIILSAALTMITLGNKAESENKLKVVAYLLLQRKMEEVTALPFSYNITETDQMFPESIYFSNYRYSVNQTYNFEGSTFLKKVTVTVKWPAPSFSRSESLSTCVADH